MRENRDRARQTKFNGKELCRTTSVATGPRNFIADKGKQHSRLGEVFVCAGRAALLRCITKSSAPASVHVSILLTPASTRTTFKTP
jgi:hypothetical protein